MVEAEGRDSTKGKKFMAEKKNMGDCAIEHVEHELEHVPEISNGRFP